MDMRALTQVIDDLTAEHQSASAEVSHLRHALAAAEARRADVEGVLSGLRRLLPPKQSTTTSIEQIEADLEADDRSDGVESDHDVETGEEPPRQRIRSTELVAELVERAGVPLTRDEVIARFEDEIGFLDTWRNPRNTIGNALARATSRRLIVALDGDRFASRGYELI